MTFSAELAAAWQASLPPHHAAEAASWLQRAEAFYEQMLEANQRLNLTRITAADDFFLKHIWDSSTLLPFLPEAGNDPAAEVLDVGTGGGVPGLPLWLFRPDLRYTLMDSVGKKLRAVDGMAAALQSRFGAALPHLPETLHTRAETAGQDKNYRERFDCVVTRAVGQLPILLEICLPLVKRGGRLIVMKGPQYESETIGMNQIAGLLGGRLGHIERPELPGEQQRTLLVFEKRSLTPKTLPRGAGVPQKQPLSELLCES